MTKNIPYRKIGSRRNSRSTVNIPLIYCLRSLNVYLIFQSSGELAAKTGHFWSRFRPSTRQSFSPRTLSGTVHAPHLAHHEPNDLFDHSSAPPPVTLLHPGHSLDIVLSASWKWRRVPFCLPGHGHGHDLPWPVHSSAHPAATS